LGGERTGGLGEVEAPRLYILNGQGDGNYGWRGGKYRCLTPFREGIQKKGGREEEVVAVLRGGGDLEGSGELTDGRGGEKERDVNLEVRSG